MRLTEAKYQGGERIVVILDDLPHSEVFDIPVEKAGPPIIDKRSGVLVLSFDLLDYSRYAEPNTMPYEEAKTFYPWQAELAGTEKQIRYFLQLYFPTWSTDKAELPRTSMWDEQSIARAAAAAERSGAVIENSSDQFSKILEARYAKDYTAFEAFERYEALMDDKRRHYGNIIIEDREYGEGNDQCYAQLWGWILDVASEEEAKKEAAHFARELNVPYTAIEIDDHPEPYGNRQVFCTWLYIQECPGVDQHYSDPIHEARYYKQVSASEVYDRMEDVLDYTKHDVDTPVVGIVDYGMGRVNNAIENSPEVAYVEMLVKTTDEERAEVLTKEFLDSKGIPYHDITTELASDEETYVIAQWVDPITEARYYRPREFTAVDLHQVGQLFKKHETLAATGADPFIQVSSRLFGDVIFHQMEFWHDTRNWREEDAKRDAIAYMKANRLPYNHYKFREFGNLDKYISKFRFGHPHDNDKPVQ